MFPRGVPEICFQFLAVIHFLGRKMSTLEIQVDKGVDRAVLLRNIELEMCFCHMYLKRHIVE